MSDELDDDALELATRPDVDLTPEGLAAFDACVPAFFAKLQHSPCLTTFVEVEAANEAAALKKILAHWPGSGVTFCEPPSNAGDCTKI